MVTVRCEETEKIDSKHNEILEDFDRIIYTGGKAKAVEVRADIWIDDNPITLCCDFVQGQPSANPARALHQGYKIKHILWNWEKDRFCSYIKKPFNAKNNNPD